MGTKKIKERRDIEEKRDEKIEREREWQVAVQRRRIKKKEKKGKKAKHSP